MCGKIFKGGCVMIEVKLTIEETELILGCLCNIEHRPVITSSQKVIDKLIDKIGKKLTVKRGRCDEKI